MKCRTYSKEFKLDALNLVKVNGSPATAKELGISETSLQNWAEKYNFSRQVSPSETIEEAWLKIFKYIEIWHNRQ